MKCTAGKATPLGVTGDHDWVLVKSLRDYADGTISRLLWACPCSEFRWTSYAESEKAQVTSMDDIPAPNPEEERRRIEQLQQWADTRL